MIIVAVEYDSQFKFRNLTMNNDRLSWIDNCRGLCLVLVIIHHTGLMDVWFLKLYLPIFLTCFFFISGYLFFNPEKNVSIKQKLINIMTSILIPYIIYCSLTACFNFFKGGVEACIYDIRIAILGIKSWFISALFLMQIMALSVLAAKKYYSLVCLLFITSSAILYYILPEGQYVWNFRNALLANVYFGIGMFSRRYKLTKVFMNNSMGIACAIIYIGLVVIDVKYNILYGNFNESFSSYPYFFISSMFGITAFIWVCSKISRYNIPILFIGANSLLYYYLQSVVLRGVFAVYSNFGIQMNHIILLVIITSVVCLIIWPIVLFINNYIPIMSGKYRINLPNRI